MYGVRCAVCSYLYQLWHQLIQKNFKCRRRKIVASCWLFAPVDQWKMENKFYAYKNSIMTSIQHSAFFNLFSLIFASHRTILAFLILIKLCADSILFTFIIRWCWISLDFGIQFIFCYSCIISFGTVFKKNRQMQQQKN